MITKIRNLFNSNSKNKDAIENIALSQGKILSELQLTKEVRSLSDVEWRIFSQWGEDGIIQFLVNEIDIKNKTFIEFGIEDFSESNCRYLMMSCDWQGFVIDGSKANIARLIKSSYFWKHDLQAHAAFIDKDNVNQILQLSGFDQDLGILSVDIDGNDYHILRHLTSHNPRIIICEYNPIFGTERSITIPYDKAFRRSQKHFSNLYFGTSISALAQLLRDKGYSFVGSGMMGANAFFIRDDLMTPRLMRIAETSSNIQANFRESRNQKGELDYLRKEERAAVIRGLPVLNTNTNKIEKF